MILKEAGILLIIGAGVASLALARKSPPSDPSIRSRVSLLSGAGFVFGLVALSAVLASLVTAELAVQSDALWLSTYDVRALRVAAEVLRFAALVPALAALAFGLAGRGAIRESQGTLRGRALYRTAVVLSLLVAVAAFTNSPV